MKSIIEKSGTVKETVGCLYVDKLGRVCARLSCAHSIYVDGNLKIKDVFFEKHTCETCGTKVDFYNEAMKQGAGLAANHMWTGLDAARAFFIVNRDRLIPANMASRQRRRWVRGLHTGFFKSFAPQLKELGEESDS